MSVFDLPTFEVEDIADLDHEHDDDCRECGREGCGALNCGHEDFENGCEEPGCGCGGSCPRWLSASDCPACDGDGEVWFDVETVNGAVREASITCLACGGTGDVR
jgi:DnaJ-class molecular chaperone